MLYQCSSPDPAPALRRAQPATVPALATAAARALSSALLAAAVLVTPAAALADEAPAAVAAAAASEAAAPAAPAFGRKAPAETVYFGNGCFWCALSPSARVLASFANTTSLPRRRQCHRAFNYARPCLLRKDGCGGCAHPS
jgi:hypothetical protein